MSIQIITDMNANTKICAIADKKHTEIYSEGESVGSVYSTLALLIASVLTKSAEEFIKNEETREIMESEFGDKIIPLDAAIIFMHDKLNDLVAKQLAIEKIERDMGDELPDELKKIVSRGIINKIMDELKKGNEEEDDE